MLMRMAGDHRRGNEEKDEAKDEEQAGSQSETREQPEPLKDATQTALLEGRVVLTSITTLFGFQLNVVFNETFEKKLTDFERQVHLGALALSAIAIGIVMLPSAYGRQAEPRQVSRRFIRLTSRSLTIAMAPMLVSIALDFDLIAMLVFGREHVLPKVLATALGVYFAILWFIFPRIRAWQLEKRGKGPADDPSRGRPSNPPPRRGHGEGRRRERGERGRSERWRDDRGSTPIHRAAAEGRRRDIP